jgi:hypothetical protein
MRRGVVKLRGQCVLTDHAEGQVQRHRRQELLVSDPFAVTKGYTVVFEVEIGHFYVVALLVFWQKICNFGPNRSCPTFVRKSENSVWPPTGVFVLGEHIPGDREMDKCY